MSSSIFTLIIFLLIRKVQSSTPEIDSAIFDASELEFSKDITTLITEATLRSKCDGNIMIISPHCEQYIDNALASIVDWAPPILIVKFQKDITKENIQAWTNYLSRHRKSCSLVFICDLKQQIPLSQLVPNETIGEAVVPSEIEDLPIKHLKLLSFFTGLDQILYFSEIEPKAMTDADLQGGTELIVHGNDVCYNERTTETEKEVLKKTGVILPIRVERVGQKARMQVCSACDFCASGHSQHYEYLGEWQRNVTHFGKYLNSFENKRRMLRFNNFHFRVGYFEYFPHFACPKNPNFSTIIHPDCLGIEWELLTTLRKSLQFTFNLTNIGNEIPLAPSVGEIQVTNFTAMLKGLQDHSIDLALGGITVTADRHSSVGFSQVFETEPIVFVVRKPKNIFVLGIWLAFQPHVWPIIILLVAIMSFLFQRILNNDPSKLIPCPKQKLKKSLSLQIDEALLLPKSKPFIVKIFDALQLTLQPMLGQPLSNSQICRPRRFKILLVLWWFSCLIITTLYSTSLISSLINPVITKEPESLPDLIQGNYHFQFAGRHAAVHDLINATIGADPDLTQDENHQFPKLIQTIRSRLVTTKPADPTLVAYILEESGIGTFAAENGIKLSSLKIMKERLFITGYSLALRPEAHYKLKIDRALGRLNAGGLIEHWSSKFLRKKDPSPERKFRLRERLGQINLNLKILQGAFIFLIIGLTFSLLIFCMEHLKKRYRFQFYSRTQLLEIGRALKINMAYFYHAHVADSDDPEGPLGKPTPRDPRDPSSRNIKGERFRRVVSEAVRQHHQEQSLTFLK